MQKDRRQAERRAQSAQGPTRIAPSEAPAEALERLVSRRQLHVERGDVVITREPVPRLKPATAPLWQFRITVYPAPTGEGRVFTSFQHAASEGELLATEGGTRLMFVEDDTATLLNDYRR